MKIWYWLILAAVFLTGVFAAKKFYEPAGTPQEQATVLLEKIQAVSKLVTVEGHFSEIYNYSEYQGYFSFFWDKKVLVRVQARVSAGFDLEKMQFTAEPATKTIRLSALPEPQILSIDHSLDYYDISEGIFATFSPDDYNRINARAKDLIRDSAAKSNLLQAASEQGAKTMDLIKFMVESAGWRLEIGQPQGHGLN